MGKFGWSFSWKRATGISRRKAKISRAIGVPLSKEGRRRKFGPFGLGLLFGKKRRQKQQEPKTVTAVRSEPIKTVLPAGHDRIKTVIGVEPRSGFQRFVWGVIGLMLLVPSGALMAFGLYGLATGGVGWGGACEVLGVAGLIMAVRCLR